MLALIIGGIAILLTGFITGILALMGVIPPFIYIIVSIILAIISGILILLIAIATNGALGPFMISRFRGHTLFANITASGGIQLVHGPESEGIVHTQRGDFLAVPEAMYTWPNGVRGAITWHKYAASLPVNLIAIVTALRKAGIGSYNELKAADAQTTAQGGKLEVVETVNEVEEKEDVPKES